MPNAQLAVWRKRGVAPRKVQWKPPLRQAAGTFDLET